LEGGHYHRIEMWALERKEQRASLSRPDILFGLSVLMAGKVSMMTIS